MQEMLTVDLKDRSYLIYSGTLLPYGTLIRKALPGVKELMVVSNETIAPLYLDKVHKELEQADFKVHQVILPDGEAYKTVDSYMQIMTALIEAGLSRDCALAALGGGVVGDMTGFAAATFTRGVDYVQIPTTLLAMVDSSVGGKTAINHPLGKNMIGAFYQPKAVIADLTTLDTLPRREIAAGMGEVIKYGIIYDSAFFELLEEQADLSGLLADKHKLAAIVRRCCEIKAQVVAQDEREGGLRAILNLGHTFAHALESYLGFGTWLHGEAVGLGLLLAAKLAQSRGLVSADQYQRIEALVRRCELPCAIPEAMQAEDFLRLMRHDKKVKSGTIRYVLPQGIGRSQVYADVSDSEVSAMICSFKQEQPAAEDPFNRQHPSVPAAGSCPSLQADCQKAGDRKTAEPLVRKVKP